MKCKYEHCAIDRPLLPYEERFGYHVRPCLNMKHKKESFTRAKWTNEKHNAADKAAKESKRRAAGVAVGRGRGRGKG